MDNNDGCVFPILLATILSVCGFYAGMYTYREFIRKDAVKNNVGYYSCDENGNVSFKWKLPKDEEVVDTPKIPDTIR